MSIKIIGLEALKRKLDAVQFARFAKMAMTESVFLLQNRIAVYPTPPPGSTYRRTGTLGKGWTTKVSGDGLSGTVGNNIEYVRWVQDAGMQAQVHRGRWLTAQGVIERENEQIADIWNRHIKRELEK